MRSRNASPGQCRRDTVADHVVVLDEAIAQLPAEIALGHRPGDDPSLVQRTVVVRAVSAGCSEKFAAACRAHNVGFSVVCRSNRQIHSAIFDTLGFEDLWSQAVTQNGEEREGAAVISSPSWSHSRTGPTAPD